MAFVTPAQRKVLNKKSPSIPTRAANPTSKAGSKNSLPTKAGAKRSVIVNRDSSNSLKGPRVVKTGKNNPDQVVKSQGTPRPKSSRINYKLLRTIVKK